MAVLKGTILVLRAMRYNMTDEKTGEVIQGCKVTYIQDFDSIEKQNSRGVDVIISGMPFEAYAKITEIPAWYGAKMNLASDSKGKATLALQDIEYIGPLAIDPAKK